ncbi:MAG: hypothetical protein ACRDMV_24565 [Streptosporangiales bacterium]
MRRLLTAAAAAGAAIILTAPAAQASTTKFEFDNVTFPDGRTGTVYASTKTMDKKPDNVYCGYQSSDFQPLGHYLEFLEPAPSDAQAVENLCLAHFDDRQE